VIRSRALLIGSIGIVGLKKGNHQSLWGSPPASQMNTEVAIRRELGNLA
jgi:hypothetical protein